MVATFGVDVRYSVKTISVPEHSIETIELKRVPANESGSKSSNLSDEELLIGSASYKMLGTGILYVEVYLESNGEVNIVVL